MPAALRRERRLRAVARRIPGLSPVYWKARNGWILRRGVSQLDYPAAPIRIRANTDAIVRSRLRPTEKEPWTVEWLERNLRAGDVLYDVGANVGVYSLIAGKLSAGKARVIAFEPAYANYEALCENLLLNGLAGDVVPIPVVLGATTRLGSLSCQQTAAGSATHTLDGDGPAAYDQPVLVYALDELIETFTLPPPTLVKLDVDGSEAAVLAGAVETLAKPGLRSLVVEIDVANTERVLDQLGAAGFALVERFDERDGMPLPDIWYGVFERNKS